jgi:hypothetical protein
MASAEELLDRPGLAVPRRQRRAVADLLELDDWRGISSVDGDPTGGSILLKHYVDVPRFYASLWRGLLVEPPGCRPDGSRRLIHAWSGERTRSRPVNLGPLSVGQAILDVHADGDVRLLATTWPNGLTGPEPDEIGGVYDSLADFIARGPLEQRPADGLARRTATRLPDAAMQCLAQAVLEGVHR